jgi:serine/threonine protein kinase
MKGGRIINKGFKGFVYDSKDLIKELRELNGKIILISIDDYGKIFNKIVDIMEIRGMIDENILVKKFLNSNIISGNMKDNFHNELNGYKKMIKIFGKNVLKYTTIKQGFIYKGMKIYGLIYENFYWVFLEKCQKTINDVKFTQKTFDKFTKMIMNVLKILEKNNYLHNDIKPSNIIECNGKFKLIDWEMSYDIKKQVKGFYFNKNGNFLYNHPIKFYYSGIPLIINKLLFGIELLYDKDMRKLKSPLMMRKIIEESLSYLNQNKYHFYKYSDYFAFTMVYIYIAEKNNLKISLDLINPILQKFYIKLI